MSRILESFKQEQRKNDLPVGENANQVESSVVYINTALNLFVFLVEVIGSLFKTQKISVKSRLQRP